MHTLFLISKAPAKMEDSELENHIKRLLFTLDSIRIEMADSWDDSAKQVVMPTLRLQLAETVSALDAAMWVYEDRQISMR